MKKILYTLVVAFFVACGGKKTENAAQQQNSNLAAQIQTEEKKIDLNKPDKQQMIKVIGLMQRYADSLPKDPKSPALLLKASDYYAALGMHSQKNHLYRNILEKYPSFKDADMVQYLYASSLDSDFDLRQEAKKEYEAYIKKYPNSTYVNDAKGRLLTIDSLSFKQLEDAIVHGKLNLEQ